MAAESLKCPPGKHWVSSYMQGDYHKADGTFVRAHTVSAHCRTNPKGYDKWHSKLKTGRPHIWGYKEETTTNWSTSEIERVLEAISDLPDGLVQQESNGIYRMRKSQTRANTATTNDPKRETVLYDAAFQPEIVLARTLAHELAHLMFVSIDKDLRWSFLEAADWISKDKKNQTQIILQRPPNQSLTLHSRSSPHEDFATSIEFFLFDPNKLKKTIPKVHTWIERRLGDRLKVEKKK